MSNDADKTSHYPGPERRARPPEGEFAAAVWALKKDFDDRHGENTERNDNIEAQLRSQNEKLDALSKGFANNDPEGHRRYHESLIKKNEERAELYQAIKKELVTRGFWAALIFVAGAVWVAIKVRMSS